MRIGEINQHNYTEFTRLFSKKAAKAVRTFLSQSLPELSHSVPQAQENAINPYANPGQDITGRTDWKKIVPVSKDITDKLLANVKEDFEERNGMTGDHNDQNDRINNYLKTLPPEERPSASWTLDQVMINEANRYVSKIRQHNPKWTNGEPFDTNILDEESSGERIDRKA